MKLNFEQKELLIKTVVDALVDNPEMFGEIVMAMQYGLTEAILVERRGKNDLAAGLVQMVELCPRVVEKHRLGSLYFSLTALAECYRGAPIHKRLLELIAFEEETEEK